MKIELDKDVFKDIDHAFSQILQDKNKNGSARSISRSLKKVFPEMDIDVLIIDNKVKDSLFIMSVYPDQSTIDKLVEAIVNEDKNSDLEKIWAETKKWTIEIDGKILDRSIVDVTSEEMTAILLHELGHVVYSNSIPQRISKVMRLEYARAGLKIKQLMKNKTFSQLLELPILHACIFDNYKTSTNIKKELKADVFVVKMGYRDQLDSVLKKLIAVSNNKKVGEIDQSSQDVYSDMKSVTMFSINTVKQLEKRHKKVVRKDYDKLLLDTPSKTIHASLSKIVDSVLKNVTTDDGPEITTESVVYTDILGRALDRADKEVYLEFFSPIKKKMARIQPDLIDQIRLMIKDIKTNNDKIVLVSYIYSKIDQVNYYISIIDSNTSTNMVPHTRDYLVTLLESLGKLRDEVMNYSIKEIDYNVYIGYPEGYEG